MGVTAKTRDHLVPFCWIDDVEQLLERRRHDQIIYDEVPLTKDSADRPASLEQGQEGTQGIESTPTTLRRVDLKRSSFADSCTSRDEVESLQNDLVPGVYEGGLKVWESSVDLIHYMHHEKESALPWIVSSAAADTAVATSPIRFLELGCGHGLPSCYVLQQLARNGLLESAEICMADYNDYVLKDALVSNVVLNLADLDIPSDKVASCIKLACGDWFGLLDDDANHDTTRRKFDWIAATETLYTVESARETALLIARLLRPEMGQAWVASKRYYFGVGGGVDAFREAASALTTMANDGMSYKLDVQAVRVFDNGQGNIRELLRVRLQKT